MHLCLKHQGPLLPFTPETLAFHTEDLVCLHTKGPISLSHQEPLLPFTPGFHLPFTQGTPSAFHTRVATSCYTSDPFCLLHQIPYFPLHQGPLLLSQHRLLLSFTPRTPSPFDTRTPFAFYARVPISLSHQGPLLPFTSAAPPAFHMYMYHGCNQLMQTTLSETANCQYVFSQQDWCQP